MTKMTDHTQTISHDVLSLRQIAGWQFPGIDPSSSNIRAGVPSLQRGLVWEPQQIEMLWDSLMRGFPVGALVLSQRIQEQNTKANSIAKDANAEPTYHILDGQQRCYAITLGFNDPWSNQDDDQAILWLDIDPGARLNNSVRKYLFRVTTKAHPWGFQHGDQSDRLPVSQIYAFLDKFGKKEENENGKRPLPKNSVPQDAGLPVPMFLLLAHFKNDKLDWEAIATNSRLAGPIDNFADRVRKIAADPKFAGPIEAGLRLAEDARIVALQVPRGAMGMENIEQIFQRLNRQGTPLDAEELVYSMIKAYWPEVEAALATVPSHTTEPRLIGMAIRVALIEQDGQGKAKLPAELSVSAIRSIFRPGQQEAKEVARRKQIEDFVGSGSLGKALKWIDDHLLYKDQSRAYGLPPYLRSSLAWNSREVFTWLLALAKQFNYQAPDEPLTQKIIGIALAIHWFGVDKGKAIDYLIQQDIRSDAIRLSNIKGEQGAFVLPLLDTVEFDTAIPLNGNSSEACLKVWTSLWRCVVAFDDKGIERPKDVAERRQDKYFPFVDRLQRNRELLVYVQRSYFSKKFGDFDPSNKLMWKGHNRPWDYDHILPSNKLDGRGKRDAGQFHEICNVWQRSIGNLVAVDFAFNRSVQDQVAASAKYATASHLEGRFGPQLAAYDLELADTQDLNRSRAFVVAAKERLVDLYRDWYRSLDVASYK